jgi:hypothetical protein
MKTILLKTGVICTQRKQKNGVVTVTVTVKTK